jgi:hypothetical protein
MDEKIQKLVYANLSLQMIPIEERDDALIEIIEMIEKYIDDNCIHSIITDLIDIDPETSKSVDYCEYCHKTDA